MLLRLGGEVALHPLRRDQAEGHRCGGSRLGGIAAMGEGAARLLAPAAGLIERHLRPAAEGKALLASRVAILQPPEDRAGGLHLGVEPEPVEQAVGLRARLGGGQRDASERLDGLRHGVMPQGGPCPLSRPHRGGMPRETPGHRGREAGKFQEFRGL